MKYQLFSLCLVLFSCNPTTEDVAETEETALPTSSFYVGSYTQSEEEGIYAATFDPNSGQITQINLAAVSSNPSFLAIHENKLFAVNESDGQISSYGIDNRTLFLYPIDTISALGSAPCYIEISPDGKSGVVANYSSGNVVRFEIDPDGRFPEDPIEQQHEGTGPVEGRQEGPHAHSISYHPTKPMVFSADLGIDAIKVYDLELNPLDEIKLKPGSGPRHFTFNESGDILYVINELSSTIDVISINQDNEFEVVQTVSTLPEGFDGESYCADIHFDISGEYLLGSNRGHNSIVSFKVDEDGKLNDANWISEEINWPRNFAMSPDGNWLLVANQKSNSISVYTYSKGKSTYQSKIAVNMPVCIKFYRW